MENHVELRTGRRVSQLDTARQTVTLDNGEEVTYDRLLLATGAAPWRLTCPARNCRTCLRSGRSRTPSGCTTRSRRPEHEGRPNAAAQAGSPVIGGGVLGVELAAR